MPAKNLDHDAVRDALIADGWTITDDPLTLVFGGRRLHIDLGAEKTLAAEKDGEKIAVEIQSLIGASAMADLHQAIGQYVVYRTLLDEKKTGRELFLAVSVDGYDRLLKDSVGELVVERNGVKVLVYDPISRRVVQWIR